MGVKLLPVIIDSAPPRVKRLRYSKIGAIILRQAGDEIICAHAAKIYPLIVITIPVIKIDIPVAGERA